MTPLEATLLKYGGTFGLIIILSMMLFRAVWPTIRDVVVPALMEKWKREAQAQEDVAKVVTLLHQQFGGFDTRLAKVEESQQDIRQNMALVREHLRLNHLPENGRHVAST